MPPKKGGKKGGKATDNWDDDAAERRLAALAVASDKEEEVFSEEEAPPPPPKNKNKMAALMMMDDDDDDDDDDKSDSDKSEAEPEPEPKKVEKKPEPKKEAPKKDNKKAKKGKKGGKGDEEDDLDALLAAMEVKDDKTGKGKKKSKDEAAPAAKETTPEAAAPAAPAADAPAAEPAAVEGGEADGEGGKKKKKKKKAKKGGDDDADADEAAEKPDGEDGGEKEEGEGDEAADGEGGAKKKKKKKKNKEEKEEKKEGGKKKHVSLIKELLRAKQEAEEAEAKRIKEEEERLEAIQLKQEEEERVAREKREANKEKKRLRDEELKKQGKYLTPAQKEKLRRQQAFLASGNFIVPGLLEKEQGEGAAEGEVKKKMPNYGKPRKSKQQQQQKQEEKEATPEVVKEAVKEPEPVPEPEPVKEDTPESEDDEEVHYKDDVLDDWEMADDDEEEEAKEKKPAHAAAATAATTTAAAAPKKGNVEMSKEEMQKADEESSSDESDSDEESSSEEEESSSEDEGPKGKVTKEEMMERVRQRLKKRRDDNNAKRSIDNLRAPVICVLGHVDTGKTKMLDTIRRTNVQDGEAGGITQQIGATQVPAEAIKERCRMVRDFEGDKMKIPGFLIIDTPGHESFSNLRSRGSSLCDYAILVVDIMHGLEPQTIESLKLLLKRKTPFVIALNKIDRLYNYESNPRKDVYAHLKSQPSNTQLEFKERYEKIVTEFAEQGVNVALSNQPKDFTEYIPMVPTSAFMGDGVGNIMAWIVGTTQTVHAEKLAFSEELDATVMEVKAISGLGTTIDVILVNGSLSVGDIIVITGTDGAIMTPIRELLMPQPLKELRVKNEYGRYKTVQGAQGIKVLAKGLEKALAGLPCFVARKEDEIEVLKEDAEMGLEKALTSIKKKSEGVYVQASTLGSLEALLEFLKSQKIPYSNVNIGPVHKKDVQKAAVMLEHKHEYACILAFDVRVEKDAQQFADKEGVKIFAADIIYHLEDNFLKYREDLRLKARAANEHLAIFPCKLRVMPQHVFNARNPIVCGVSIEAGQLKKGTPICVPSKDGIFLGTVSSIERNHDMVDLAKQGEEVCIKIENTTGEAPKLYGRHFTHEDVLVSRITRDSIDACKTYFRDDLTKADWQLIVGLKKLLDIM